MRVSILVPTLNSAATLAECLGAIRAQDYPRDDIEIIVADAGSTDATLEIAHRFKVDKIVPNPLKTGEAGKAAAAEYATGELLALIDSDNIMPSPDWITRMTAPFADLEVFASEPIEYTCRPEDTEPTRYFALLGMNDPLCLFIGNYDRHCAVTGRWTDLPVETGSPAEGLACQDDFLKVRIDPTRPLPTIGANGFIIRRSALEGVNWKPYWFDVDVVRDAAIFAITKSHESSSGKNSLSSCNSMTKKMYVAKVKCGVVHLYCATMQDFARKQKRRVRDFLYFSPHRSSPRPVAGAKKLLLRGIIKFTLATLLWLPLVVQARRGRRARPDTAWRLHATACRITLRTYALGVLEKLCGLNKPADRRNWKQ